MLESQIISCFGASVRSLRHELGLSQEALAEYTGLHRTYIAGIEGGGRNVTLKSIEKLAKALQVSIVDLLLPQHGPGRSKSGTNGRSSTSECVDILMVEDNRDDVQMTLEAFKQAKLTNPVQVVYDGREALDFLFCTGRYARRKLKARPQLVLLDLNLPRVGGLEVLRRIKADARTRSIPVVVLTGSRDAQELAECRRLGAEASIVKPVDFHSLGRATPRLDLHWALLKELKTKGRTVRA